MAPNLLDEPLPGDQPQSNAGETTPGAPTLPLLGSSIEFTPAALRAYGRGFTLGIIVGACAATLALLLSAGFALLAVALWLK